MAEVLAMVGQMPVMAQALVRLHKCCRAAEERLMLLDERAEQLFEHLHAKRGRPRALPKTRQPPAATSSPCWSTTCSKRTVSQ